MSILKLVTMPDPYTGEGREVHFPNTKYRTIIKTLYNTDSILYENMHHLYVEIAPENTVLSGVAAIIILDPHSGRQRPYIAYVYRNSYNRGRHYGRLFPVEGPDMFRLCHVKASYVGLNSLKI